MLVSTFITMTEPKYRCSDCKKKYPKDKDKRDRLKRDMACDFSTERPRHQYRADHNNKGNPTLKYPKCIGNYYFGSCSYLINIFPQYEKGLLPFEGGLLEQPAKFVEAMNLVHNLIKENEQEIARKNEAVTRNLGGRRSSKR